MARIDSLAPTASASGTASIPPLSGPPVVLAAAEAPAIPPVDTPSPLVLPASPASQPTPAAAGFDANALPASLAAETLLHVTASGRFAISAHSASGAAITLVNMVTGPSDPAELAGSSDGRLDCLLDIGTYKLRVASAPGTTGQVQLRAQPFREAAAPATEPELERYRHEPGRSAAALLLVRSRSRADQAGGGRAGPVGDETLA